MSTAEAVSGALRGAVVLRKAFLLSLVYLTRERG